MQSIARDNVETFLRLPLQSVHVATAQVSAALQNVLWKAAGVFVAFGAVDLFLIATVLLIFSFGIYELFISKIDVARGSEAYSTLLEISTLDDLKNKIIKVIVMVLIVSFFQRVLELQIYNSFDMLMMAVSISAICIGVYFLHKLKV